MASRIIYVKNPYLNFFNIKPKQFDRTSLNTEKLATELKNKFILGLLNLKAFKQFKNKISFFKKIIYSNFSTDTFNSLFIASIFQFILSWSFNPNALTTSLGTPVLKDTDFEVGLITLLSDSIIIISLYLSIDLYNIFYYLSFSLYKFFYNLS